MGKRGGSGVANNAKVIIGQVILVDGVEEVIEVRLLQSQ